MIGRAVALIALLAAGCQAPRVAEGPAAVARFYLEAPADGATRVVLPVSELELAIEPKPVLTEHDFATVELTELELGKAVTFGLTPMASRDLYRLTAANQGRRLVLVVEGEAVGARPIEAPIEDGMLAVFIELPDEELPELVRRLERMALNVREARKR